MDLLSLPHVMIENIFSYLPYDEVAKLRQVSKAFDNICSKILNRGFMMIEKKHSKALKLVKSRLPRRESERRDHPLSRHCDILTSIETRISMLNMTFLKYIDAGLCCFIPGKVLDEISRVLRILDSSSPPGRPNEVLQELRDISSMAIEHFDDKISPSFRNKLNVGMHMPIPGQFFSPLLSPASRQDIQNLRRRFLLNAKLSLRLAFEVKDTSKQVHELKSTSRNHTEIINELTKKQRDQDAVIGDLKKRVEVYDAKFTEGVGTSGPVASTSSSQPLRHVSSQIKLDPSVLPIGTSQRNQQKKLPNIKPRNPVIRMPSLSEDETEPSSDVDADDNQPSSSYDCLSLVDEIVLSEEAYIQSPEPEAISQNNQGITTELRHIYEKIKLKRLSDSSIDSVDAKKPKFE